MPDIVNTFIGLGNLLHREGQQNQEAHREGQQNQEAREYYEKALQIANQLKDYERKVQIILRLGDIHYRFGNHLKCKELHQKALDLAIKIKYVSPQGSLLRRFGNVCYRNGKNNQALEYFEKALNLSISINYRSDIVYNYYRIGDVYYREKKHDKALKYYLKSKEISESICYELGLANSLRRIGNIYFGKKKYALAKDYYCLSLNKLAPNSPDTIYNLFCIGDIYKKEKNIEKSMEYYNLAVKRAYNIGYKLGTINSLRRRADLYREINNYDDALDDYSQVINLSQGMSHSLNIFEGLCGSANIMLAKKNLPEAFNRYNQSIDESVCGYRKYMTDTGGRFEFNRYTLKAYEGAIYCAIEIAYNPLLNTDKNTSDYWFRKALSLSEECRGLEIDHQVNQLSIKDISTSENWKKIQKVFQQKNYEPFPKDKVKLLEKPVKRREIVFSDLPDISFDRIPQKNAKNYKKPDISDLIKNVDHDTVVISFFILKDKIIVFIFCNENNDIHFLIPPYYLKSKNEELQKKCSDFLGTINCYDIGDKNKNFKEQLKNHLQKMYMSLEIDKIKKVIRKKCCLNEITLLIEPDGFLHGIPFQALYDGKEYLYEQVNNLHTCISLRTLVKKQIYPDEKDIRCVFFGVPGLCYKNIKTNMMEIKNFLPGVIKEADKLRKILKKNVIVLGYGGEDILQSTSISLQKYHSSGNLLYISAHGNAQGSVLLLDGKLHWENLFDEANWDFRKQLTIILSCCLLGAQSSIGKEMVGMISALHGKGAYSVISALWAVDDEATSIFMPTFIEYLQENLHKNRKHPRARAMKMAINKLRENPLYDNPHYFAPFFICGIS